MLSNIRISPAQAVKEQSDNINPVIDRVMRGERFRLTTDRLGFTYRFEREDETHFTFYINDLLAGVTTQGAFFPVGFVLCLNMLGVRQNYEVLIGDVRFVSDEIHFNVKGGDVC